MVFDFQFRTVESRRDLSNLVGFIRSQNLNYPNYQDWVGKTESEIEMGWKTGILALSNGVVVGDIIWQPHKELPRTREIKNMRVHPTVRNRYFARFLMKQAEVENLTECDKIMLDLREDHAERRPLATMLTSMGYREICAVNFYDPNVRDIVMVKRLFQ